MVDVPKQVDYWRTSSNEDFAAAESLLEKGHLRHSLFFAHLAIEKMLKAHVTRQTKEIPPRIHNLIRLAELAKLKLDEDRKDFFANSAPISWKGAILTPCKSTLTQALYLTKYQEPERC